LGNFNNEPYGNFEMLSKDGDFLCYTTEKKMNWYLTRSLAKQLNDKKYQLNFITKGDGNNVRGEYYKIPLENKCVVCGSTDELTKHHVVPSQYRKKLPERFKSKSSFDVLCVCDTCHNKYEKHADDLKLQLLVDYGLLDYAKANQRAIRCHNVLKRHYAVVPEERLANMTEFLEDYLQDSIENIIAIERLDFISVTDKLMNGITDHEAFILMWREHFIEKTKPQHLHESWLEGMATIF
tara:strand:+ start:13106 stop:13819 length:714 start_codon:yes stop_codon:yes gene_type:complete